MTTGGRSDDRIISIEWAPPYTSVKLGLADVACKLLTVPAQRERNASEARVGSLRSFSFDGLALILIAFTVLTAQSALSTLISVVRCLGHVNYAWRRGRAHDLRVKHDLEGLARRTASSILACVRSPVDEDASKFEELA